MTSQRYGVLPSKERYYRRADIRCGNGGNSAHRAAVAVEEIGAPDIPLPASC